MNKHKRTISIITATAAFLVISLLTFSTILAGNPQPKPPQPIPPSENQAERGSNSIKLMEAEVLTLIDVTKYTITVSIVLPPGAYWYNLQYRPSGEDNWLTQHNNISTGEYTFTGLTPFTQYDIFYYYMPEDGSDWVMRTFWGERTLAEDGYLPPTPVPQANISFVSSSRTTITVAITVPSGHTSPSMLIWKNGVWEEQFTQSMGITSGQYTFTGLEPYTSYDILYHRFNQGNLITESLNGAWTNNNNDPTPSPTPTISPTPTPSPTPTISSTPTPSPTPTISPTPTLIPTPTPTPTPRPTPAPQANISFVSSSKSTITVRINLTSEFRDATIRIFDVSSGSGIWDSSQFPNALPSGDYTFTGLKQNSEYHIVCFLWTYSGNPSNVTQYLYGCFTNNDEPPTPGFTPNPLATPTPIPAATSTPLPPAGEHSVSGQVVSYNHKNDVAIKLMKSGLADILSLTRVADTNGKITTDYLFENVPLGSYMFEAKKPGHLSYRKLIMKVPNSLTLPLVTLIPGDINNDGQIDSGDFSELLDNYGKSGTRISDLNGDGQVDALDLSLLLDGYGKKDVVAESNVISVSFEVEKKTYYDIPIIMSEMTNTNANHFYISYDTDILEFVLIDSGGNVSNIQNDTNAGLIAFDYTGNYDDIITFVKFKRAGFGSTTVDIATY